MTQIQRQIRPQWERKLDEFAGQIQVANKLHYDQTHRQAHLRVENQQLSQTITEMKQEHTDALDNLELEYQARMSEQERHYEQEMENQQNRYEQEIEKLKLQHRDEINRLEREKDDWLARKDQEIDHVEIQHCREIDRQAKFHRDALEENDRKWNSRLREMNKNEFYSFKFLLFSFFAIFTMYYIPQIDLEFVGVYVNDVIEHVLLKPVQQLVSTNHDWETTCPSP